MARAKSGGAPAKSESSATVVRFDRTLASKVNIITERRGGSAAQYLASLCREQIDRDYAQVVNEMAAEVNSHG